MLAKVCADFRGLTWTVKSPRECRGLSRTVLVRKSPQSDFPRWEFHGHSWKSILAEIYSLEKSFYHEFD